MNNASIESLSRGRNGGRKAGEPTKLARIYEADAAKLKRHGATMAEAVKNLLAGKRKATK